MSTEPVTAGLSGATNTSSVGPGFFGKLPSRGDFVSRNLGRSFIEPWDNWLQRSLSSSRDQLGDSWLQCYLSSPIWRFLLSANTCGNSAVAGIFIPSVDRVGRYFPLTIAAAITSEQPLLALMAETGQWYQQAEAVVLTGLEDNLDLEAFAEQVLTLGYPNHVAQAIHDAPSNSRLWHCQLSDISDIARVQNQLSERLLVSSFPRPSLWWTQGSEQIAPCLLLSAGLPPADSFVGLLAGDWQQWGWAEIPLANALSPTASPQSQEA